MRVVLSRLLAVCLLLLMQGPALLVQELAWARMLVRYSQERGLARGVVETFDGEHPCPMCLKAAKMRHEERKQDPAGQLPDLLKRLAWMDATFPKWSQLPCPISTDGFVLAFVPPLVPDGISPQAPVLPPPKVSLV